MPSSVCRRIVKGECSSDGDQEVHYLPSQRSECLPRMDASWPTRQKCQASLPFVWEVAIQVAIALASTLSLILICFWRRHRKLEYKYMKLVASGGSRANNASSGGSNQKDHHHHGLLGSDMMPMAESCALDPTD